MKDILSDLTTTKYKIKNDVNNNNVSEKNNVGGDILSDLSSSKYKLKSSVEETPATNTFTVEDAIRRMNTKQEKDAKTSIIQQAVQSQMAKEKAEKEQEQERWDNLSIGQKIVDPIKTMGANIKYGDLGIKENQAWSDYRSKQDEESLAKAQEATKAREEYETNNNRIGKGNALTKDFAQYLPQLGGQMKSGLGNATGGAVAGAGTALAVGQLGPQVGLPEELITVPAGALWGGRAGYVAGTAKYSYDVMAGNAYKNLLDMGVPNEVALELSGDEALINSLIEGTGAVVDLVSLGLGKLASKSSLTAAQKLAQNKLMQAGTAYGMNLISEPLEEMAQEKVSIETEKKAANMSGIERQATDAEDAERIKQSGIGALKVSAISGLGNAGGNIITNKVSDKITQNKINNQIKQEEIQKNIQDYKQNSPYSKYITQNQMKGLENLIPQKNGVPQSAVMNSENIMQQTNRIEGKMAQNGNIEQIAKNVENSNILEYNNDRGVENGEKINGERYTFEVRDGLHEESTQENRQYNTTEYEQWEQSLKPIPRERLTTEEIADIDNTQKEYGKTVNLIDENENSNKYSGGASLTKKGQLNISRQQAEYFGLKNMIEHEVVEDDILHDDVANDILTPAIDLIMQDTKFDDQKKAFWKGQTDNIPTDELIAKDILCDRFAEIKNNTKMKYDNVLSPDVNTTVDMALQNYYKQVYGKELNINNIKADTQSAFSMPKNEVQSFASSESLRPYMDLDRYTSRDNKSKANQTRLTDIQNAINDIVTVKTGKFRQNAYGIYKTHGEIIRLKQSKDIPVALHELTHHLDKKYNLSSSDKAFNELKKIAVVGKNATKQTTIAEGVAEFGRYYMTDKEYAKEIAPNYYDAFEKALSNDPGMKDKVENIRQMVTNYLDQSPLNRLSSNIDYGDEQMSLWGKAKEGIIKTAHNFRKNFVDDLDPLKKIVNEIAGDNKLMTEQDAYKLLRLNNGVTGKVQVALEYGVVDKNGKKIGKSLKEILKPVSNNQKEFTAYLTALRAKDLRDRGIESGLLSRDVDDVIKAYSKNETFNEAAKALYNFQNQILETTLVDSGIITKDAMKAYNKNNPHYIPFYRVMDENFKQSKDSKSKKPSKIKGSTRDIINPLESIIKNTYSYMQMAERNDTYKTLFDMANRYDGTGKWFDKVPTDMTGTTVTAEDVKSILEQLNLGDEEVNYNEIFTTLFKPANKQKGNIVTVMEKGKPVHYEINDKELYDILSPTIKGDNVFVKFFSPGAKALRVGATHTLEFVMRNPLRDTMDAGIYSKNGFIPFVDTIKGIFDVAGRSDLYYKWLQSGGSGSTYTNAQRPVLQKTLKGLTQATTNEKDIKAALNQAVELVKHPLRTYLDAMGTISNVAEEATRVGEFRRALQQGKTEKEAALDSREITLDFSRGGEVAKDINKGVAFFNAELQGLDKMFSSFKDRPLATTIKGIAYLTIPAMILRGLQDEEKLEKVPQWEKDEFFIVFVGDTPIKIPKPQGLGQLFATFPERIVDYIRTNDIDAFDGFLQRLITSYVPIDSTTSILPNSFMPLIEIATGEGGYSYFKQQPIVKQSLQNRSPRYQYDDNTSTIAKTIGDKLNVSPKKIDHLISGYFGNLGKDVANIAGLPIDLLEGIKNGGKKEKEYKSTNAKLKQIPLLKGFIAGNTASKELDKFYENKAKASTDYTDAKFKYSDGNKTKAEEKELEYYKEINSLYNSAYNDIKKIDEQMDEVRKGPGTNEYKENKLKGLKNEKEKIANDVEGKVKNKQLKAMDVKFNK